MTSPRPTGVTLDVLDYDALALLCRKHGLRPPGYTGNGIIRNRAGHAVVLSTEGVGITEQRPGLISLDTQAFEWEWLPLDEVKACATGSTVDLADHIRSFGSRLEVNFSTWYDWAQRDPIDDEAVRISQVVIDEYKENLAPDEIDDFVHNLRDWLDLIMDATAAGYRAGLEKGAGQ